MLLDPAQHFAIHVDTFTQDGNPCRLSVSDLYDSSAAKVCTLMGVAASLVGTGFDEGFVPPPSCQLNYLAATCWSTGGRSRLDSLTLSSSVLVASFNGRRTQRAAGAHGTLRCLDTAVRRLGGGAGGSGPWLPLHEEPAAVRDAQRAGCLHV